MNELLALANINVNDIYLTNAVKCRPPQNKTPRKALIKACWPWLREEIKLVKPEMLITLGAVPLSLFSNLGVTQAHGTMMTVEIDLEENEC